MDEFLELLKAGPGKFFDILLETYCFDKYRIILLCQLCEEPQRCGNDGEGYVVEQAKDKAQKVRRPITPIWKGLWAPCLTAQLWAQLAEGAPPHALAA